MDDTAGLPKSVGRRGRGAGKECVWTARQHRTPQPMLVSRRARHSEEDAAMQASPTVGSKPVFDSGIAEEALRLAPREHIVLTEQQQLEIGRIVERHAGHVDRFWLRAYLLRYVDRSTVDTGPPRALRATLRPTLRDLGTKARP